MTALDPSASSEGVRLSKRVAELRHCSRREAEAYIEGGWVRVAGRVVETPQARVRDEPVEVDPNAKLAPWTPVSFLLHKPAGVDERRVPLPELLSEAARFAGDRSGLRRLQRQFQGLECVTPLELGASGLLVFTQDGRIRRKLVEEAAWVEHEATVDVRGTVSAAQLAQLNQAPVIDGRAMLAMRVSVSRQQADRTGLRFALKGYWPGQIAQHCAAAGLEVVAIRRIRIGRLPMAGLPAGQWRFLMLYEKF